MGGHNSTVRLAGEAHDDAADLTWINLFAWAFSTLRLKAYAMAANQQAANMTTSIPDLPTAQDLMKQIALKEAAKAADSMRAHSTEDAEKKALIEKFSSLSGVSDAERMVRAAAMIKRAADNGNTEVQVARFPNGLCTDHGRAINQQEPGWEGTLTGLPKELFEFWQQHLKQRGYKLKCQIVDFPNGMPGDIGITLSWG